MSYRANIWKGLSWSCLAYVLTIPSVYACRQKDVSLLVGPSFALKLQSRHLSVAGIPLILRSNANEIREASDTKGKTYFHDVPPGRYKLILPVGWVQETIYVSAGHKRGTGTLEVLEPTYFKARELSVRFRIPEWVQPKVPNKFTSRIFRVVEGLPGESAIAESHGLSINALSAPPGHYLIRTTSGLDTTELLVDVDPRARHNTLNLALFTTDCGPYWNQSDASSH